MDITARLFELQDCEYQAFQSKLMPTVDPARVIGVRMPDLRSLAKELKNTEDAARFMSSLPHDYYEEDTLHGLLSSEVKDPAACIAALDPFLPLIDNWATCDVISPVSFKKHPVCLIPKVREWLASEHAYVVRFGIGVLMKFYLDEAFDPVYPEWVAAVQSEEYYVNMMIAWYFATALAKQPEYALPYLEDHRLAPWTHNKTIQKARESYRIPAEMKEVLSRLKV